MTNAFALLALGDNEDPNEALERNVTAMMSAKNKKPVAAAAPAPKAVAKDSKPKPQAKDAHRGQDKRNNTSDRQQGDRSERGERRPRREGGERRRRESTNQDDGGRPARREKDRKSGTGRRPQEHKGREESKLNLGKQTEAEADAAADVEEKEDAEPEPEVAAEPEKVTQTLAEYKATLTSTSAKVMRKAGDGEDASKWKSTRYERDADETYAPKNKNSRKAKGDASKSSDKKEVKTLKPNFKFDSNGENDRPRRSNNQRDGKKGGRGANARSDRAPDISNKAAFPGLA